MRLRPADLNAFAEFNAGTIRARMARYLDDNPPPRSMCGCGARTRSETGTCRRCSRQETR